MIIKYHFITSAFVGGIFVTGNNVYFGVFLPNVFGLNMTVVQSWINPEIKPAVLVCVLLHNCLLQKLRNKNY
jgi:hypothetical protein